MSAKSGRVLHSRSLLSFMVVLTALALFGLGAANPAQAQAPRSVFVAGDFASEAVGCNDWDPGCPRLQMERSSNRNIYQLSLKGIPAGLYLMKITHNGNWDVEYGMYGTFEGDNIPFRSPGKDTEFVFTYDLRTHLTTIDALGYEEPVALAGDFLSKARTGCVDWQPNCPASRMTDPDGDGVFTYETDRIPAGRYEVKVTIWGHWNENYGRDGQRQGENIGFVVPRAGLLIRFEYNARTHGLKISTVQPSAAQITQTAVAMAQITPTATRTPSVTPTRDTRPPMVVVGALGATIHTAPSNNAPTIATVNNVRLPLLGITADGAYYFVDFNGQRGWMFSLFGRIEGDKASAPVIVPPTATPTVTPLPSATFTPSPTPEPINGVTLPAKLSLISADNAASLTPIGRYSSRVRLSPSLKTMVVEVLSGEFGCTSGACVLLLNTQTGEQIALLDNLYAPQFTPDGKSILGYVFAQAANQTSYELYDTATGKRLRGVNLLTPGFPDTRAISPDGRTAMTGVTMASLTNGRLIAEVAGDPYCLLSANAAAISPGSRTLATDTDRVGADVDLSVIKLWPIGSGLNCRPGREYGQWIQSGRPSARLVGHTGALTALQFSNDGRLLASGGQDNTVRVWDVARRREVAAFTGLSGVPGALVFSPNGKLLVVVIRTSQKTEESVVWDIASQKVVAQFPAAVRWFSTDGKALNVGNTLYGITAP